MMDAATTGTTGTSSSSPPTGSSDDADRYFVEDILASRKNAITGSQEYLIKWVQSDQHTWESKTRLVEDGLSDEIMEFDQMKQQRQPVATDAKRATLLGKLLGRRSETVSNSTPFDVHPDTKPRAAASFAAGKSAPLATPLHTGAPTQNDTPMTAVPQHPIESISRQDIKSVVVEGPVEPDPSEYCTPRPESPHTTNVPTFEVDDSRSVVKKTSFIRASPGRSPAKSNNVNKNSPGRILKNRLYATAEDSRIFVAAHRPRSISSEGLFMGYIHPSSSSSNSSNSSNSSSKITMTSNMTI